MVIRKIQIKEFEFKFFFVFKLRDIFTPSKSFNFINSIIERSVNDIFHSIFTFLKSVHILLSQLLLTYLITPPKKSSFQITNDELN